VIEATGVTGLVTECPELVAPAGRAVRHDNREDDRRFAVDGDPDEEEKER
jgi:hypothetical protein